MSKRSQFFLLPLSEPRPPSVLGVLLVLLPALYAPFLWIPLQEGAWDPKRWFWLKSLPALPGLFVQSIAVFADATPTVSYSAMGAATFLLLVFAYLIGRQSRGALIFAFLCVLGTSGWNSWLAYQSFNNL